MEFARAITLSESTWSAELEQGCTGSGAPDLTPAHVAAERGDVARLSTLIAAGANPDAFSSCGTPLHAAARAGSVACIDLLLAAGAQIDAVCPEGLTAVLSAAVTGNADAVCELVVRGADLTMAFLPGTHMNLLHVCAEQDLVSACATILQYEQGRELALCPGKAFKPLHTAALASERESDTEILNMLLPFSGVPLGVSRAELIRQAQRLAQGKQGSFHPDDPDPFDANTPHAASTPTTASAAAGTLTLHSQFFNGPVSAPPRLSFTPTANLDCSPADCSPSSRFDMSPCTPPLNALCSSPSPIGIPSPMGSCSGMHWDLVDCLRPPLRVKTRVSEPGPSSLHNTSYGGASSHASSASAVMMPRMGSTTSACGSDCTAMMRSYDDAAWAAAPDGQRSTSSLPPASNPFTSTL